MALLLAQNCESRLAKLRCESVASTVEITIQIDGHIFGIQGNECHRPLDNLLLERMNL